MNFSPAGYALLKESEGCKLYAYDDATGQAIYPGDHVYGTLTIGYGDTGDVVPGQVITEEEADARLAKRLPFFEVAVLNMVKVPLTQGQFDALVDFAYNLGSGALAGSTLLKLVNAGDMDAAADQFGRWVHTAQGIAPGLVRRREREREMFLGQDQAVA